MSMRIGAIEYRQKSLEIASEQFVIVNKRMAVIERNSAENETNCKKAIEEF